MHEVPKTYDHLKFPEGLTAKDRELIIKQCEIQDATEDNKVLGFAEAYLEAKKFILETDNFSTLTPDQLQEKIIHWGELTEERNKKGYRTTEVTFANGSKGLDAIKVPQAMESLIMYSTDILKNGFPEQPEGDPRPPLGPDDLYKEFEEIHPFEDGNGRVGDLLWKIAMTKKTGQWPEELPPNMFS